jgi:hypothetical protein
LLLAEVTVWIEVAAFAILLAALSEWLMSSAPVL